MVVCPQCKKKLELFEEERNAIDGPNSKRYTCNKCAIFIDIKDIKDKEVLKMIGYEEDE